MHVWMPPSAMKFDVSGRSTAMAYLRYDCVVR